MGAAAAVAAMSAHIYGGNSSHECVYLGYYNDY